MNFSEFENKVFETDDINEHHLEPELKRIKGIGKALVYGDPYGIARKLDGHQGDNIYDCKNNDGPVSVLNVLRMAGVRCSENEIVKCAIDNNWCRHSIFEPEKRGDSYPWDLVGLLKHYGIPAEWLTRINISNPGYYPAELENVADFVESGRGVIMELSSELLSTLHYGESPDKHKMSLPLSNRYVTVTGTARNPENGALEGLFICDSEKGGFGNKAIFVPTDTLKRVYGSNSKTRIDMVLGASIVVTDKPIR